MIPETAAADFFKKEEPVMSIAKTIEISSESQTVLRMRSKVDSSEPRNH